MTYPYSFVLRLDKLFFFLQRPVLDKKIYTLGTHNVMLIRNEYGKNIYKIVILDIIDIYKT